LCWSVPSATFTFSLLLLSLSCGAPSSCSPAVPAAGAHAGMTTGCCEQGGERKPGHPRVPVNSQDEDGLAAVHWAAMRGGQPRNTETPLRFAFSPVAAHKRAHASVWAGHKNVLKYLIETAPESNRADATVVDKHGPYYPHALRDKWRGSGRPPSCVLSCNRLCNSRYCCPSDYGDLQVGRQFFGRCLWSSKKAR
jgi:hypothetical protein